MKVLLVSPSKELEQNIRLCLQVRWPGFSLAITAEDRKPIELVESEHPDIAIIDFGSDSGNSFDLLSEVRRFSEVPVIVLSGSSDIMDKVMALEMGADDWVTKPLIPMELLAKVNAVLRRCGIVEFQQNRDPSFVSDKLTINYATSEVCVSGKRVRLTPTEYRMLCHLVRNEGRVVTHHSLLERVWGSEYVNDVTFVKKYIYRLRSKLEDKDDNPQMLVSERGLGYRFIKAPDSGG